jgi:hypothetical protein
MKKMIITLLAAVIIMSVMGGTFAAAAASTKHATDQQPTSITITQYPPKQVTHGQDFDIKGQLTSGGTGIGDKLIYHSYWDTTDHKWYWDWNFTTNPDGSFTDTFRLENPGSLTVRYEFWGDAQYAACVSDQLVITAT